MTTRIIIARHGNTFRKGETPTRVGAKTDLPLVENKRGTAIGKYLKKNDLLPSRVYASPLKRAMQTAQLAMDEVKLDLNIIELDQFTEVDYGPDENKTEEEVKLRLGNGDMEKGQLILDAWDKNATVPEGWRVDPSKIIESWFDFANNVILKSQEGETVLLVTSNGIIRFAPYLTGDFEKFSEEFNIKVSTGGICVFEKEDGDTHWTCKAWNIKPYDIYKEELK